MLFTDLHRALFILHTGCFEIRTYGKIHQKLYNQVVKTNQWNTFMKKIKSFCRPKTFGDPAKKISHCVKSGEQSGQITEPP